MGSPDDKGEKGLSLRPGPSERAWIDSNNVKIIRIQSQKLVEIGCAINKNRFSQFSGNSTNKNRLEFRHKPRTPTFFSVALDTGILM